MIKSSQNPKKENPFKEKTTKSQEIPHHQQYIDPKFNRQIVNNNMPISIYNSYIFPNQSNKDFSVKFQNAYKGKLDTNKIIPMSPFQQNGNNKFFSSHNLTNSYSDLCTSASFSSNKSSESFYSNNNGTNTKKFVQNNFCLMPNSFNLYNSPKKMLSPVNNRIDLNKNYFCNSFSSKGLINIINNNNIIINPNITQNFTTININSNNNTFLTNEKNIPNFNFNNIINNNNNNNKINNETNYFNTQKSIDLTEHKNKIYNDINIDNLSHSKSSSISGSSKNINFINNNNTNNLENQNRKKNKNYYNKFNTTKENSMNENTIILSVKIKVAKNDYRTFNLKKYDDLFVSLEKFVDLNKIRQELVKPLVTKIFNTLNKIFWLLNNKIGIYDRQYLHSLYKLWIKNNKEIPKTKNKTHSDKSTTTSSDSSSENSFKDIKSNSYQNSDGNSSDDKGRQHTSKSF